MPPVPGRYCLTLLSTVKNVFNLKSFYYFYRINFYSSRIQWNESSSIQTSSSSQSGLFPKNYSIFLFYCVSVQFTQEYLHIADCKCEELFCFINRGYTEVVTRKVIALFPPDHENSLRHSSFTVLTLNLILKYLTHTTYGILFLCKYKHNIFGMILY